MKRFKNILFAVLSVATTFALSCCVNDNLPEAGGFDGPVSLTLRFKFNPLAESLTRGVESNLDFEIRDLTVLFYESTADENSGQPAFVRRYTLNKDYITEEVERDGTKYNTTEPRTRQAYITIDDIERNSQYRIYAAANIADLLTVDELETYSEKSLREYSIEWSAYNGGGSGSDPRSYGIPDAMFGYFSTNRENDDVIYHNTTLRSGEGVQANRAETITFTAPKVELHAWLKRTVSRLTVGFDGSRLDEGVEIYIKSVHVRDAVSACALGYDNTAASDSDFIDAEESADDPRLNHIYNSDKGASGDAITKATPAYPRTSANTATKGDGGWNSDWYEYVHGNATTNLNPTHDDKPTTLYFMENVQGVSESADAKGRHDDYEKGGEWEKDGKPNGTYVEVKAYYKNGTTSEGAMTYRFMLGQNITDDFNALRNCHYKLTLSFIGTASNADWHIEFEEEDKPYAWFPIPTEEQWNQSWVWRAYNDEGEPVAEICREMVYYHPTSELDWTKESSVYGASIRWGLVYYQVVTVYPVKKNTNPTNSAYTYTVDLSRGTIAQVLACATKASLDESDLKAGGSVNMLLRTQASPDLFEVGSYNSMTAMINGNYAIRSLTNGGAENSNSVQVWSETFDTPALGKITMSIQAITGGRINDKRSFSEDKEADTGNYIYAMQLGEPVEKQFQTKPFYVTDANNNNYSVVKIGGSYWSREYVKATNYFKVNSDGQSLSTGGPKIYEYRPPKETQTYTYWRGKSYSYGRTETREITGDPENGYDYDFGPSEEYGYVAYYERFPMYKDCNGVRMYNFFAASGSASGVFDNEGNEVYKKGTVPRYSDSRPAIDPIYSQNGDGPYDIDQGKLNISIYNGGIEASYDTADGGEYRNNFTIADMSSQYYQNMLAPENWHALPVAYSNIGYCCGFFGELQSDCYYLEAFSNFNWGHYCSRSQDSWTFPDYTASYTECNPPLNWNISGLSIPPIPTDRDTNQSNIDIKFSIFNSYDKEDALNGRVFPFWESTIDVDLVYYSSNAYPMGGMIVIDEFDGWFSPIYWPDDGTVWSLYDESYQPIRFVRNAYDYSVAPLTE